VTAPRRTRLKKEDPENGRIGTRQRLIANTIFNFLGQFYMEVLAIAVVPFVIHRVGNELCGLLMVVAALGGFAGLLNPGIGRALSKYASELYWQGELRRIKIPFQTASGISLIIGVGGFLLLLMFRGSLSSALFHAGRSTQQLE
jgi:O-antigen/teichoic acid export membrane protein